MATAKQKLHSALDFENGSPMVTAGPPERNDNPLAHIHVLADRIDGSGQVVVLFPRAKVESSGTMGPNDPASAELITAAFDIDEDVKAKWRGSQHFELTDLVSGKTAQFECQFNADDYAEMTGGNTPEASDYLIKIDGRDVSYSDGIVLDMITGERLPPNPFAALLAMLGGMESPELE